MAKYEFTGETLEWEGRTLKRIRYVGKPRKGLEYGQIGGWIESENNLSQTGRAFVHGEAKVYGNARVEGNSDIYGFSEIYGNAYVKNSIISGESRINEYARVFDSVIGNDSIIYGHATCDKLITITYALIGSNMYATGFWAGEMTEQQVFYKPSDTAFIGEAGPFYIHLKWKRNSIIDVHDFVNEPEKYKRAKTAFFAKVRKQLIPREYYLSVYILNELENKMKQRASKKTKFFANV